MNQPQMGGRYAVNSRWGNTAATATFWGMPAADRPAIMPASTRPIPPGTGETAPTIEARVMTTKSMGNDREAPKAWRAAPRASAVNSWAPTFPKNTATNLRGWWANDLRFPHAATMWGLSLLTARWRILG